MTEGTTIVAEQIAEEMLRQKSKTSATDAIMYLRSLVGSEFDQAFHAIARRLGENEKKQRIIA